MHINNKRNEMYQNGIAKSFLYLEKGGAGGRGLGEQKKHKYGLMTLLRPCFEKYSTGCPSYRTKKKEVSFLVSRTVWL